MKNKFEYWHPFTQIIYYIILITVTVCFMHPVVIFLTLAAGLSLGFIMGRKNFLRVLFGMFVPVILLGIIINPLFSHEGMTILRYFPDGNPLTLESIIYGIVSGFMVGSICALFYSFNKIMTSDRVIYLTGRIFPALSLIISMTLRFIPEFSRRFKEVSGTQKYLGRSVKKNGISILSAMITWAFESSVIRADSMRVRGYGVKLKRSSYSLFRITTGDVIRIAFMLLCAVYVILSFIRKTIYIQYYPYYKMTGNVYIIAVLYGAICFLPVIDIAAKEIRWKYTESKI
jgi:ABC-type cobalt transport system, permease component cbiQ and related transporters